MDFLITARNLDRTENSQQYLQRKLAPVQRRLRDITEAKVEIKRESTRSAQDHIVVQVTLNLNGTLLRAEERGPTVNAAVDVLAPARERQVMRYKGRRFASLKATRSGKSDTIRSYAATFEEAVEVEEEEADRDQVIALPAGQVARVKRFPMKPMTVEEASTQM